ncbi:MAG: MFS transporter [Phycisphaerae bacterium]
MKSASLKVILLVAFVDLVSFGLIIPLLPDYAKRFGASGLTLGLVLASFSFTQMIFSPILGRWSDHVGRRRVLLLSIAGSVVAHVLLGVADLYVSLPMLFAARILDGITGANIATAQAYIADVTTPENRARGMGFFGAAFGLGFVIGPGIGAGLYILGKVVQGERLATSWPAFGAAVISLVALTLVWWKMDEPDVHKDYLKERGSILDLSALGAALRHPRLAELFCILFTSMFSFVLLEVSFVYLCKNKFNLDMSGIGLLFAYIGVMMVIVQGGLVGRLAKRFGEAGLVAVGPFVTASGFLLIAVVAGMGPESPAWPLLLIACVPVSCGNGITTPNLNALISRQAAADHQGGTLGLGQGFGSLARTVGPVVGGWLYDQGPALPYWTGGTLFVLVGLLALHVRQRQHDAVHDRGGVAQTPATSSLPIEESD